MINSKLVAPLNWRWETFLVIGLVVYCILWVVVFPVTESIKAILYVLEKFGELGVYLYDKLIGVR